MKARVQVWASDGHLARFHGYNELDMDPDHHDGLIAQFDMNPHDPVEWHRLRERMLRAVEARQCIVVSG